MNIRMTIKWTLLFAIVSGLLLSFNACSDSADSAPDTDDPPMISDLDENGEDLVERFFSTIAGGDPEEVSEILSPSFQILRATGVKYDRDDYLQNLPEVREFTFEDLHTTRSDDVLIVTYVVVVDETLEGVPQQTKAPRLTSFHWDGTDWLVSSHSNFGAIQ